MKLFFCLLFSCISFVSISQLPSYANPGMPKPLFFLDSTRIDPGTTIFDPNEIEKMSVENGYDTLTGTKGKIYITLKKSNIRYFISLSDIKEKYAKGAATPMLLMLNDDFVQKNTSAFKIDSSYILNVQILKGADFDSLKESLPNLTIIRIKTKTKENLENANRIRIRGTELSMMK